MKYTMGLKNPDGDMTTTTVVEVPGVINTPTTRLMARMQAARKWLASGYQLPDASADTIGVVRIWGEGPHVTPAQVGVIRDLVATYEKYEAWLEDGDKADNPAFDSDRVDWLYEIADVVSELVAATRRPKGDTT